MLWPRIKTHAPLAIFALVLACTTDDCGCDGFEQRPFPEEAYDNTIPGGGQVRLTRSGLRFIEDNVGYVLEQFMPDGLSFCIPEDTSDNPKICVDSICRDGSRGCQVDLAIDDAQLTPVPSRTLRTRIVIGDIDEALTFDYTALFTFSCEVKLFKNGASDDVPATITAEIPVTLDTDRHSPLRELKVDVGQIDLDLSDVDFKIRGRDDFGDTVACGGASLVRGLFRGMIEDQIRGMLDDTAEQMASSYLCRSCGAGQPSCPTGSTCENGYCKLNSSTECVPTPLGIEGRVNFSNMLGNFALSTNASMDVMLKAADHAAVDTGVSIGMRSGFEPRALNRCVPGEHVPRPDFAAIPLSPVINADTKPNSAQTFMVGIGLHKKVIEHAVWSVWAGGATCLAVSTEDVEMINTGAFGALLPSLRELTNGRTDALFHIVPQGPPNIVLGANTIQPVGGSYEIRDPLLTLDWKDLDLHIFGYALDRFVRLFTLRLDLHLPLALIPDGRGSLLVVMDDISGAIQNVRPHKAELIAEDPQRLIDILPTLLNIALPAVAESIPDAIELPEFFGFRLDMQQGDITTADEGNFLAIFANFARTTSSLRAELQPVVVDHRVDLTARTPSDLVAPTVELDLFAYHHGFLVADDATVEYSYRVNGGPWSLFHTTNPLPITHPFFLLQGHHTIELRARHVGNSDTTSPITTSTTILLDWQAPELTLDRLGREIRFEGFDAADPDLEYRYRLRMADGQWTDFTSWSAVDRLDTSEVPESVEIEVETRDEAGHVTAASMALTPMPASSRPASSRPAASGCASAPGSVPSPLPLLLFGLIALFPRRRKLAILAILAILAMTTTACDGCKGELAIEKDQGCLLDSECADFCDFGGSGYCQEGQCACTRYCAGGCTEDQYCCFQSDSCEPIGDVCGEQSCQPGYAFSLVRVNPDREACVVDDFDCDCRPLPPVPLGLFGPYSDIASNDDVLVVSTYNRTYRDLMIGLVADDGTIDWHFVDGLPEDAPIVGDPDGPRGGMAERGGRVGLYSSVAVDQQGTIHALYRDVEARSLKYARGTRDGQGRYTFETTTLDATDDAGYWTAIAIDGDRVHGVHTARLGGAAWSSELRHFSFPTTAPLPSLAIEPTLVATAQECTPRCNDERFPHATGLFADLKTTSQGLLLTYFDGQRNRPGRTFFKDGSWEDPTFLAINTGPYVSGAVDQQGTLHLAFMSQTNLRHLHFADESTQTRSIHEGIRDNPDGWYAGPIGDDISIAIDGQNRPIASFQDAYDHALYVARKEGDEWTTRKLHPEGSKYTGAHGFYSAMTVHKGIPVIVEYVINNRAQPPEAVALVHRVE